MCRHTKVAAAAATMLLLCAWTPAFRAASVQDEQAIGLQDHQLPKNNARNEGVNDDDQSPKEQKVGAVGKAEGKTRTFGELLNVMAEDPRPKEVGDMDVHVCTRDSCTVKKLREVKRDEYFSAAAITAIKGDTRLSNLVAPTISTIEDQLSKIESQSNILENLKRDLDTLTKLSETRAALASLQQTGNKGASLLPEVSKAFELPAAATKGNSLLSEACPMVQFELASTQKQYREAKQRLDQVTVTAAALQSNKNQLENALKASEALREATKNQALANAREAAEEKGKNSMLTVNLIKVMAEKKAATDQKDALEDQLSKTQSSLLQAQQDKSNLESSLQTVTEEKQLCNTNLQKESEALQQCNTNLATTVGKLADTEKDLADEREARRKLEVELSQLQAELRSVQSQLKVTNSMLKQTQEQLAQKTQDHIKERSARQAVEQQLESTQQELRQTQEELASKERELGEEKVAHGKVQRQLEETQAELAASEDARKKLEEKKQELEDDLASTKNSLGQVTAERDQLQEQLDEANKQLNEERIQKAACQVDLAQEKAEKEAAQQQLAESLARLAHEKKIRDELETMIEKVREASAKVQEEVQKLQLENALLQEEMRKLKGEQETALALAAGCPPTYEKHNANCYKYIRQKLTWKGAQEQCMQDSGNLVSIESKEEQLFLVDLLRRYAARETDTLVLTGGQRKPQNIWKWNTGGVIGVGAPSYWHRELSKSKAAHDCLALTLQEEGAFAKWVSSQCTSEHPFICEYSLLPNSGSYNPALSSQLEVAALRKIADNAPSYLAPAPLQSHRV